MKTLRFTLAILILAAPALADVTATVTTNARQDAQLAALVTAENAKVCASLALPASCTDAEAKAKNPQAVIYANTNAFATAILRDVLVRAAKNYQDSLKTTVGNVLDTMTNAEKNAVCARLNAKSPEIPATGCWP